MKVTFLGTSAARPTVERNVTSVCLTREGETLMFDCGEGTQRQMMRYGVSFALSDIFVTHFHADHYLGIIGLLRTLGLQGRPEPMRIYGPRGARALLGKAIEIGYERVPFEVEIVELQGGASIDRGEYDITPFDVQHGTNAIGYSIREHDRLGRFDPDKAMAMGIPEGPAWGRLHRGETVTADDGRTVTSEELVGPARPGRTIVITGDTRPCEETVNIAAGADLLIHDGTFGDEEVERAAATGHSTATQAAQVALASRVKQLAITHLSARYSRDFQLLKDQAREVFPETVVAKDGMEIEVKHADA